MIGEAGVLSRRIPEKPAFADAGMGKGEVRPSPDVVRESEAFTFPFFLAGAAQADAGQGFQTFLGNGLAAFTAAGLTVDPLRPFPVL